MEELKELYQKLKITPHDKREQLWKVIIQKNRAILNQQKEALNKILKRLSK